MPSVIEAIRAAEVEAVAPKKGRGLVATGGDMTAAPAELHQLTAEMVDAATGVTVKAAKTCKGKATKAESVKAQGSVDRCWEYLGSKAARGLDRKGKVAHLVSLGIHKTTAYCQTQRHEVCSGDRKAAALYGRGKAKASA